MGETRFKGRSGVPLQKKKLVTKMVLTYQEKENHDKTYKVESP